MITTYLSVYPDQTIQNDISSFEIADPIEVCEAELSAQDYAELINLIDFRPTGVKEFHFADNGECIKIVFQTRDGERTFYFGQDEYTFDFQAEADSAWKAKQVQ